MEVMTLNKQRKLLLERPEARIDALLTLYKLQTESEQRHNATFVGNGIGFNAYDAPIYTKFAKILNSGEALTPKQLAILEGKTGIAKYAKQMRNITNGNLSRMMK